MERFAAVFNTYGYVGKEVGDFCAVISEKKPGMNRGCSLVTLLSLLGVYANAEKVLLAHAPSKKRSQRGEGMSMSLFFSSIPFLIRYKKRNVQENMDIPFHPEKRNVHVAFLFKHISN